MAEPDAASVNPDCRMAYLPYERWCVSRRMFWHTAVFHTVRPFGPVRDMSDPRELANAVVRSAVEHPVKCVLTFGAALASAIGVLNDQLNLYGGDLRHWNWDEFVTTPARLLSYCVLDVLKFGLFVPGYGMALLGSLILRTASASV